MNLTDIESRVAGLGGEQGFEFIFGLLAAYGFPRAAIARLRSGGQNRATRLDECLWKGRVWYRFVESAEDLHVVIDGAAADPAIAKLRPRFLVVRDRDRILGLDLRTRGTLDVPFGEFARHFEFFLPWAGIEKAQLETLNYADVRAAEKMARLYDEIIRHNEIRTDVDVHDLNVFFSRLLFCFFAEDTQVFTPGQFTNALASLTTASGDDVHSFLDQLFSVLNTETSNRTGLPPRLTGFGYVNGNLFNQRSGSPRFSAKARRIVLECGTLDWSEINPDIFGSMIQAVVHPSQREGLGMHYTSVENIMKVMRPLFLDELHTTFGGSLDSAKKLRHLLSRIYSMRVFDPACGSGNFLVVAYKELRKLEHQILEQITALEPGTRGQLNMSGILLENFYGIEIDDFAHEIAVLSLWLAKHQMNIEFHKLFGVAISLIPLKDTGNIVCGNATRLEWDAVCPSVSGCENYVLGNPPYRGSANQTDENKADLHGAFDGISFDASLDYVAAWFVKGSQYVAKNNCALGFLSTNSICQGAQVALLWPHIFRVGAEISFAYPSFAWSNHAKGQAGVTVVIIGLSMAPVSRRIYLEGTVREVTKISPYLVASTSNLIVEQRKSPLADLPEMVKGSQPTDAGHLLLDPPEARAIIAEFPGTKPMIRRFMGADEFLSGKERYCLWIDADHAAAAQSIRPLDLRIRQVQTFRNGSKKQTTRNWADRPWSFTKVCHRDASSIIVPSVSSERREYIPMGFLDGHTVISNLAYAIYGAQPWVFGMIQSRMHMVWMRALAGRMKTDYRYSTTLVYNTFPVPVLSDGAMTVMTEHVFAILEGREQFAGKTLAELYDAKKMPDALRRAHHVLDETVDGLYQKRRFSSDEERLELLFDMYGQMTSANTGALQRA